MQPGSFHLPAQINTKLVLFTRKGYYFVVIEAECINNNSNIPEGDVIVLFSGSSGGGSGRCTPRYFRSTGVAGSRQLSFNPTEIHEVNDEMMGNIYIIVAVSEMWINSPSCSTGWRTCLCLQRDRSCSKTASRWGMFSSSPSGLTAENTTNVVKKLVDEIWSKLTEWKLHKFR